MTTRAEAPDTSSTITSNDPACRIVSLRHLHRVDVCAIEDVLFPGVDVELERLSADSDAVTVEVAARGGPPRCPDCSFRGPANPQTYHQLPTGQRTFGDRQDLDAVTAGLSRGRPGSPGRRAAGKVEGNVNRIKTIKRAG